jgi:acetoin utilization deacetylase AcuC-like enzyme/predicted transcriptional regulator
MRVLGQGLLVALFALSSPKGVDAEERDVLMSLKPRHADRLLTGGKGYEMRRVGPRWGQGSRVLIYASGPDHRDDRGKTAKALVGCYTAGQIKRGTATDLWLTLGRAGAASFDGLVEDFKGDQGHAIEVTSPRKLHQPVPLDQLRRDMRGFRPPQMYQYIDPEQRTLLSALDRGLRNGVAPCPPGGCPADSGRAAERWLANRQGGSEQHFVYHPSYNWTRAADPLLATCYSRPASVFQALQQAGLAGRGRVHQPEQVSTADLTRVHSQQYIQRLLRGGVIQTDNRSAQEAAKLCHLKDALQGGSITDRARLAITAAGGSYTAATLALRHKTIVGNLAVGSSHGEKETAAGLETFNGPVVAARKLIADGAARRVMIIDGDLAYGGGTNKLTARDASISYVSVYGVPTGEATHGGTNVARPVPKRATDAEYLATFSSGLSRQIDRFKPELIIYNAGASPHHGDPTNATAGLRVSSRGLALRDALVFATARSRGVPVVWELGASYHSDGAKARSIHLKTAEIANQVLARVRPGDRLQFSGSGQSWSASRGVVTFPSWSVSSRRAGQWLGPGPTDAPPAE